MKKKESNSKKILEISLFGACVVRSKGISSFEISGSKHKAFFALLATAPSGRRTRAFLQDVLWGGSSFDGGRQSLRRALSDIKLAMGDAYCEVFEAGSGDITLDLSKVDFVEQSFGAEFLEGMDIKEDRFNEWLVGIRTNPQELQSLVGSAKAPKLRSSKPSIAILPMLNNLGGDDCDIMGDWLAAEISRTLSRSDLLSVTSHLSTRAVAGRFIETATIRDQLKVDYCVSGSVRQDADTIIFDADFIETISGELLWSRRFLGTLGDFLSIDAPGISNIVRTIARSISDSAIGYIRSRALHDIDEHRLLIAGIGLMHRPRINDFARARELLEELVRRAPKSAQAHAWLGKWYVLSAFNNWSTHVTRDTQLAIDQTARALDIDPDCSFALTIDGFAHNNLLKRLDIANSRYSEALRVNPNESLAWLLKGMVYAFTDQPEPAIEHVERARVLSPLDPFGYFFDCLGASAQLSAGNFERALDLSNASLSENRNHTSTTRAKITALHFLGRAEEARQEAVDLLGRHPEMTLKAYRSSHPASDFKLGELVTEALQAAGIPEG